MEVFKGRKIEFNVLVDVYRNLNKEGFYSIRDAKKGIVLGHCKSVFLTGAIFKVSEKSRLKVIANKRRSVHAYIRGTLKGIDIVLPEGLNKVYYNPYKTPLFLDTFTNEFVDDAEEVFCVGKFAYIKREERLL